MSEIKSQLEWKFDIKNNLTRSNPEGMICSYYIIHDNDNPNLYQLIYVKYLMIFEDHDDLFDDLELAKLAATEHYHTQLADIFGIINVEQCAFR